LLYAGGGDARAAFWSGSAQAVWEVHAWLAETAGKAKASLFACWGL